MARNTLCSHMPLLIKLLDTFPIRRVLEFGMGMYSTPLFVDRCDEVISIEMNDHLAADGRPWLEYVSDLIGDSPGWVSSKCVGQMGAMAMASSLFGNRPLDLVLVDGHGKSRAQQASFAAQWCGIVVVHDSQHPHTHNNWKHSHHRIDFKDFGSRLPECGGDRPWPWTTILVRSDGMATEVRSWLEQEEEICSAFSWLP